MTNKPNVPQLDDAGMLILAEAVGAGEASMTAGSPVPQRAPGGAAAGAEARMQTEKAIVKNFTTGQA